MSFAPFPHINQFRNVVRVLTDRARYIGKDENGEPMFDADKPIGVKTFVGTVKVHGTNAGITLMPDGTILAQSRSRVLLPEEEDNLGFRAWVGSVDRNDLINLFADAIFWHTGLRPLVSETGYSLQTKEPVTIFGEWAGKGIQNGVGVNNANRFFYIFAVQVGCELRMMGSYRLTDDGLAGSWGNLTRPVSTTNGETSIISADDAGCSRVEVNLDDPVSVAKMQNTLAELTSAVEASCPVARLLGTDGIGEGIVWHLLNEDGRSGTIFKVKGEKHSVSKVKTLATANVEKIATVMEFVEKTVTDNRLLQGISVLKEQGKPISIGSIGDFIRWVSGDIVREEADTLVEAGLTAKDIGSTVTNIARQWFKGYLANHPSEVAG